MGINAKLKQVPSGDAVSKTRKILKLKSTTAGLIVPEIFTFQCLFFLSSYETNITFAVLN